MALPLDWNPTYSADWVIWYISWEAIGLRPYKKQQQEKVVFANTSFSWNAEFEGTGIENTDFSGSQPKNNLLRS